MGIGCEECARSPALKDALGCGRPPTRDDVGPPGWLWQSSPITGELLSPSMAVGLGLPPYRQLGFGEIRMDWEWCPVWFSAFSEATIGGETPYIFISRAHRYREKGELSSLVAPPWTASLVELLDFYDRLESEAVRMDYQRRDLERQQRVSRARHR